MVQVQRLKILHLCLSVFLSVDAFVVPRTGLSFQQHHLLHPSSPSSLMAKKKIKGFDKKKDSPSITEEEETVVAAAAAASSPVVAAPEEINAGQKALKRMRSQQNDKKEEELRKIKEMRNVEEYVRENSSAAVIPEKVARRMGARMLPFVGIPLFGTMGTFVIFWYLRVYKNVEFETSAVAIITIGILAVSLIVSHFIEKSLFYLFFFFVLNNNFKKKLSPPLFRESLIL